MYTNLKAKTDNTKQKMLSFTIAIYNYSISISYSKNAITIAINQLINYNTICFHSL
nr:MAG TPA: hypothetical protein [Caudoviricetes sp.]